MPTRLAATHAPTRSALLLAALLLAAPAAAAPRDYGDLVRQTPGLLLHYRFEEPGPSVRDAAGRGRDGQATATDLGQPSGYAPLGKGARLGPAGWIRVPDLGRHDAVSVELWLQASAGGEALRGLYAVDAWQPSALHLNLRADGAVEFAVHGVARHPNSAPGTVPPGRWVHLVATYDRGTGDVTLYRDGRRVHRETVVPAPPVNLAPAALGAWVTGAPTRLLHAAVDEFAVYATALTPAQVQAHYRAGKGVEETPIDFAKQVRPLLASRCFRCHGPETRKAGLRLDVRDAALRGGESGEPGVEPYDAEASHILQRVTSTDEGMAMPPRGPRLEPAEVALLRAWIDQGAPWPDALAGTSETATVSTSHWSFQPVRRVAPPADADPFVRDGNAIDAFILARLRAAGLRPAPEADRRTLVRRLYLDVHGLPPTPEEIAAFVHDTAPDAWPRLVERVLASPRYGERLASHWLDVIRYADTHGFEVNTPRDNAWPYRDYVIQSFNDDKPYDRFLREQVAGDQLGADVATGFLMAAPALLPGQVGKDEASMRQARADELHEIVASIGSAMLGLTVGCARCHNHKFDPVSQQDYYKLQAVVAGVRYGDRPLRDAAPGLGPRATVAFAGTFTQPTATRRLYRGDPMQPRERVAPDVPAVFGSLGLESSLPEERRRLALARWLTDPKHPLTARVIVNRIWQHRFGTGLVATPSDFGAMGTPPSHPELLDWLAAHLLDEGWSLKRLTRTILLSRTYRQASTPTPDGLRVDADSRLLWRFPPRRLDMEPIRDAMLAVSGSLDHAMGGPGFQVFKPNTNYVRVYDPKDAWGPAEWRRTVYAHRVRMAQDGVFGAFDCPDAGQPAPKRSRSTTALQALNLLHGAFVRQQAERLAARVQREAGGDVDAQVARAFQLALGREPTPRQRAESATLVREHGLPTLALVLFNTSEFLFLP